VKEKECEYFVDMLVQIFESFVGMLVLTSECLVHIYSKHVNVLWACGFKYENVLCSSMRNILWKCGFKDANDLWTCGLKHAT